MADGNIIKAVKKIIESDSERRFIVVSAPGKRYSGDTKVTDLLYACHKILLKDGVCKDGFAPVRARFMSIARELNRGLDIEPLLDETERLIDERKSEDFTVSRGEYLCARIVAETLGAEFINAADVIFFNPDGSLDGGRTYKAIAAACPKRGLAVFPGFYGTGADGKVKTFSRGGSDITGAVVARAVYASLYENWTDVSGFFACDPRLVESPVHIKSLSYRELRELSYMGADVLHAESVFPVYKAGIPIQIRNTFRPQDEGTSVLPVSRFMPRGNIVTGVAGRKNFTEIHMEKPMMNADTGFLSAVLSVLYSEGVPVEHISLGIDAASLVMPDEKLSPKKLEKITEKIKAVISPDSVRITQNIALIAAVGHGMSSSVGTSGRILGALASQNVNVRLIDSGSSDLSIVVGVGNDDFELSVRAIYNEFFKN